MQAANGSHLTETDLRRNAKFVEQRGFTPNLTDTLSRAGVAEQGGNAMKIVVYGPDRRTGVLRDGSVAALSGAFAKYAAEKTGEPHPIELAEALVPADLARLIEA